MKIFFYLLVIIGIGGLISVRILEEKLFYDPFLGYFHKASKAAVFPEYHSIRLILNYLFRFMLNLFFSGFVLYGFFRNIKWVLQGLILMFIFFVITLPIYWFCILDKFEIGYLFSFYMRRFVIQPIILLLILPLFFFRKMKLKAN